MENLLQKEKIGYIFFIIYSVFYLISAIIMPIENIPILDNFCRILINPVVFFGIPYLLLKHARYKELLKIYKNYTTEEFLAVYKQTRNIAYKDNVECKSGSMASVYREDIYVYDRRTLEKLRPLARDLLCINDTNICNDWLLTDWIKEEKNIGDFIREEYKKQYKFSLFNSFWIATILGIYIQLSLWGIIEYYEK